MQPGNLLVRIVLVLYGSCLPRWPDCCGLKATDKRTRRCETDYATGTGGCSHARSNIKESKGPVVQTLPLCKTLKDNKEGKKLMVMDFPDANNASSADAWIIENVHTLTQRVKGHSNMVICITFFSWQTAGGDNVGGYFVHHKATNLSAYSRLKEGRNSTDTTPRLLLSQATQITKTTKDQTVTGNNCPLNQIGPLWI